MFGLALVVVAAGAVFGLRVAWAAAASAPQPATPTRATAATRSALAERTTSPGGLGATATPGAPAASLGGAAQLVVHVVGQVRRPGVVVLPTGARVRDAVARAGGALPSAELAAVNLARPLADGEQLRIPRPGEPPAPSAAGQSAAPSAAGGEGAAGALVNLNTANQSVLEDLPGVGPVLAQRIIDWRTEHGRFTSVDELSEVSGIGEKMFAQLQGKVTV